MPGKDELNVHTKIVRASLMVLVHILFYNDFSLLVRNSRFVFLLLDG